MVYDISAPANAQFVNYINSRSFDAAVKNDVSPEGLCFVPATADAPVLLLLAACGVSGTLTVYEAQADGYAGVFAPGDCNGDGTVDVRDLVRMKKHLADCSVFVFLLPADLVTSKSVNADDLSALRRLLLRRSTTPAAL